MEVTKWLKPSISVSRIGDSARVQAATRVNAEQTSKRTTCRPTRRPFRGRLTRRGEMSEEDASLLHRGSGGSMYPCEISLAGGAELGSERSFAAPPRAVGYTSNLDVRDATGSFELLLARFPASRVVRRRDIRMNFEREGS
jgi:hypothetical protein